MSARDAAADDPFLPLAFSLFSNPGAYAVLAGAGVSRGAGLPTAWDIVVDLIGQIAGDEDVVDAEIAASWYEKKFGRPPSYSDVVEQLALTSTERQALLRRYFEPQGEGDAVGPPGPAVAHQAIARLMKLGVIRVVLTMNFDRLFEQALRELSIEPTIVATDSDAKGLAPLHTVQHCVIHLHGDYLNASSMRNTAAELKGYGRNMKALLRRVLTEYGLLVAGWSVQHDPALSAAVGAHYPSRFTMGWVAPGRLSDAAKTLVSNKGAIVLKSTADDAFGHLADQVDAMRNRSARHPLSLSVAVNRIKRELAGAGPAISAHDMLAGEFSKLREHSAFHLTNYNDNSNIVALIEQVFEAARIPAGSIAALAYWGNGTTDQWWLAELERFAKPFRRANGYTALLELPLIAGAVMFHCAGVSATAAQRFDLLGQLFASRTARPSSSAASTSQVLSPTGLADGAISAVDFYATIAEITREALALGSEPVDEAIQLYEVLRASSAALGGEHHQEFVDEYALRNAEFITAQNMVDRGDKWIERDRVLGKVAGYCPMDGTHVFAAERTYDEGENRRWGSPTAERLAEDVLRLGEKHPLTIAFDVAPDAFWLAVKGVSRAVGRAADRLSWQSIPVGTAGFVPDELWLDTGRPPAES